MIERSLLLSRWWGLFDYRIGMHGGPWRCFVPLSCDTPMVLSVLLPILHCAILFLPCLSSLYGRRYVLSSFHFESSIPLSTYCFVSNTSFFLRFLVYSPFSTSFLYIIPPLPPNPPSLYCLLSTLWTITFPLPLKIQLTTNLILHISFPQPTRNVNILAPLTLHTQLPSIERMTSGSKPSEKLRTTQTVCLAISIVSQVIVLRNICWAVCCDWQGNFSSVIEFDWWGEEFSGRYSHKWWLLNGNLKDWKTEELNDNWYVADLFVGDRFSSMQILP